MCGGNTSEVAAENHDVVHIDRYRWSEGWRIGG